MKKIIILLFLLLPLINLVNAEEEKVISCKFHQTEIKEALKELSLLSGKCIVTDNSVKGNITVEIKNATLEKALEIITNAGGYTFKKINNYYLVGKPSPENTSFYLLSQIYKYKPNYIKAEQIKTLLGDFFKPYIQIDKTSNIITINAPESIAERILKDIKDIDTPPEEVIIEAVISELSKDVSSELGIDYKDLFSQAELSLTYKDKHSSIFGNVDILKILKPFIEEGKASIKATPRIRVLDSQEAFIELSQIDYFPIISYFGDASKLETIKTGIILKITPYIAKEEITLALEQQLSSIVNYRNVNDKNVNDKIIYQKRLPTVAHRQVNTIIRIKDKQTIALGGLIYKHEKKKENRILPILSKIPLLNLLLTKYTTSVEEKELVIFITPHILKKD